MKCIICGNSSGNQSFDVQEMMFGNRESFAYFQCAQCGCLQTADPQADLSRFYPRDYYAYALAPISGETRNPLILLRNRYAVYHRGYAGKILWSLLPKPELLFLEYLKLDAQTRIMDVGCGSGRLLHFLGNQGLKNLLGVDPFIEKDIELDNGVRILKSTLIQQKGEWDILMFHHSFEHVPDPVETLGAAAKLLRPGGTCVIAIPIVTEGAWKRYGIHWVQLDAPRHICLHSTQSLNLLASECGLEVEKTFFNSTEFQFWGSEQYSRGIPLLDPVSGTTRPNPTLFTKKDLRGFQREARKLNHCGKGDSAVFYLRKPA